MRAVELGVRTGVLGCTGSILDLLAFYLVLLYQVCIHQGTSIEQANAAELLPSFVENYVAFTAIATETGEGKDCKEPAIPVLIYIYLGPNSRKPFYPET